MRAALLEEGPLLHAHASALSTQVGMMGARCQGGCWQLAAGMRHPGDLAGPGLRRGAAATHTFIHRQGQGVPSAGRRPAMTWLSQPPVLQHFPKSQC